MMSMFDGSNFKFKIICLDSQNINLYIQTAELFELLRNILNELTFQILVDLNLIIRQDRLQDVIKES